MLRRSPNKHASLRCFSVIPTRSSRSHCFPSTQACSSAYHPPNTRILHRTGTDCQHVCPDPPGVQKLKRAKVIVSAPNVLREQCCGLRPHASIPNLQGNEYSLNLHPVANELCGLGRVNRGTRKQLALGVKM